MVVLFQVCRLFFYLVNQSYFNSLSVTDIIKIFIFGTRFDLTAIIYFNLPFIILHLWPGNFKNKPAFQKFLKILFITVNAAMVLVNLADAAYFQFTDKRTTSDFFTMAGMGNDFFSLLPRYIFDYWYIPVLWLLLMTIAWFIYPGKKKERRQLEINIKELIYQTLLFLLSLLVMVLIARGVEFKPLRIISAAGYAPPAGIPLVMNTPFTLLNTIETSPLKEHSYYSKKELNELYSPIRKFRHDTLKRKNVVIIILESISKEYIGYYNHGKGYTPFLDSLIRQGRSFNFSYANGKTSIEAIPAVLAGIPSLMDNSFITSQFSTAKINSLPGLLKEEGWHTSFFHGGTNGTMGFDYFSRVAGIEHYYGMTEYPNKADFDGGWGIYDEEFFRYFAGKLNESARPFCTCIFSLSSHHPYPIPERYKTRFPEEKTKMMRSIRYTDYSLRKFFETASTMAWYFNTLFVITADHTSQPMSPFYSNKTGVYSVPVVFFAPSDSLLKGSSDTLIQHMDIMPSVLDYLGYSKEFLAFGNSVFDSSAIHRVVNFNNNIFQLMEGNDFLLFDGDNSTGLYHFRTDSTLVDNQITREEMKAKQMEKWLKAMVQSYDDRLRMNRMVPDNK